ncbi:hypothetical protein SELMODRAFT_415378 [Selaginella moellendorffii]|uniref:BAHD family acyltransferase, clade V n=2 Tax=Selaginella moellendorffii TaxID=88036 RepID=D8RVX7_SELML|nr:hypothetical protein SELMODRAFT_415378 [Selaginella moellendorffii]
MDRMVPVQGTRKVLLIESIDVFIEDEYSRHVLFLTNIDQKFGYFVRSLFFFTPNPGLQVLKEILRKGLSKVLAAYPCCAGRLRMNSSDKLEIDCNNQGARLGVGSCKLSISEVTAADFDDFFLEPSNNMESFEDLPLMNIQVTEMNNGYAISMLQHHTLGEATSAICFLMNFAGQCRGEELWLVPEFDRTQMKASDHPMPSFQHHEFGKQEKDSRYTVTSESVLKAESLRRSVAKGSVKQRKKYHLSRSRLAQIKQAALTDVSNCSTFEALAAQVWKANVAALPKKEVARMRFLVDTRSIIQPPLSRGFFGNAVYVVMMQASTEELRTEPLGVTAMRIQQAKKSVTEEYVRSGLDFLELHPDYWYHPDCDTVINAWPRAMSNSTQLDFGWGKPCRVEYPMHPGNKSIIFFPFSSNNEGLELSVSLEPAFFPAFEQMLHAE